VNSSLASTADFDLPADDVAPVLGDHFEDAVAPTPGWCGRFLVVEWSVIDRPGQERAYPLPLPASLEHDAMVALHHALDGDTYVMVALRHVYLGVPVVTARASVGQPDTSGPASLQVRDPDRFVTFAAEGPEASLPALRLHGRRMLEQIAQDALAEVLGLLRGQEGK
jgi:hypothetical protein